MHFCMYDLLQEIAKHPYRYARTLTLEIQMIDRILAIHAKGEEFVNATTEAMDHRMKLCDDFMRSRHLSVDSKKGVAKKLDAAYHPCLCSRQRCCIQTFHQKKTGKVSNVHHPPLTISRTFG